MCGVPLQVLAKINRTSSGGTQCERFTDQLADVITQIERQLGLSFPQAWDDFVMPGSFKRDTYIILSELYSKTRFGITIIPWQDEVDVERWPMSNAVDAGGNACGPLCDPNTGNPMFYVDNAKGAEYRATYGFKRQYFQNTHHFFAYLGLAAAVGPDIARDCDFQRERKNLCEQAQRVCRGEISIQEYETGWYQDGVFDRYVVDVAASLVEEGVVFDLPNRLRKEMCANNETNIWTEANQILNSPRYSFPEYHPRVIQSRCEELLNSPCPINTCEPSDLRSTFRQIINQILGR